MFFLYSNSHFCSVCSRFIQMAPLYFFYNLPPSESKDILQDMLDPDGSKKCKDEKQNAAAISGDAESGCAVVPQTYDRCVIQWGAVTSSAWKPERHAAKADFHRWNGFYYWLQLQIAIIRQHRFVSCDTQAKAFFLSFFLLLRFLHLKMQQRGCKSLFWAAELLKEKIKKKKSMTTPELKTQKGADSGHVTPFLSTNKILYSATNADMLVFFHI